jgi:hypothetical protein
MRRSYAMALGGARAELMLNPLNFISSWRNREGGNDFEVNMLVGADLGGITKSGGSFKGDRLRMYYGWTSAMQFLYRINSPGTYIFVEPRVMSAKYNSLYGNTGVQTKTNDYLFSLGVGTRVYLTNPSFNPANSNDFVPHWWAGLDFGGVKTQHKSTLHKQGGIGFNPAISMSWGYDWKPLASFRAQLAYQRFTEHMVSSYSGLNAKGNKTVKNLKTGKAKIKVRGYKTVNGKRKSYTTTETYWTWDRVGSEDKKCNEISFCGIVFSSNKINLPYESHIDTIKESSRIRYKYYGVGTKYTGTIFTELKDKTITDNTSFYNNMNIEETVEYLESDGVFLLVLFWMFWIFLTGFCVYGSTSLICVPPGVYAYHPHARSPSIGSVIVKNLIFSRGAFPL